MFVNTFGCLDIIRKIISQPTPDLCKTSTAIGRFTMRNKETIRRMPGIMTMNNQAEGTNMSKYNGEGGRLY